MADKPRRADRDVSTAKHSARFARVSEGLSRIGTEDTEDADTDTDVEVDETPK